MKIGFSGSREGMTMDQRERLVRYLEEWRIKGHNLIGAHGDCVGADAQFHTEASFYMDVIEIFPPENDDLRAFCKGTVEHLPAPYLERNKAIAQWCDVLIAAPKTLHSKIVSRGTWHTVRHAGLYGKKVIILTP